MDFDKWLTWCNTTCLITKENLPNEYQVLNVLKVKTFYQISFWMTIKEWISSFKTWFQTQMAYIDSPVLEDQKFFNQYLL